jgi:hypothetical protein
MALSENKFSIALSEIFFRLLFQKVDWSFRNFFVKGVTPLWGAHSRGFQELVKHEKMRTICH